jgi:exodeoxyribonuclease VII large subunit
MYFSLKDETASIRCVCFENANRGLAFKPRDGMEVVAAGRLGLYPQTGNYQLYVRGLREAGRGALHRDFELLKRKLMAEGLTAVERKRPLPASPRRIGVVFSEESAGYRDILNVLGRRFPLAVVVLESVAVEGTAATPSIVAGLERMAAHGCVDVVIVGRGGGSIESLWAFNTEPVARAIAAMPVPVISAVGHETDVTIADLVADRRAATPTEAAELATPSIETIRGGLASLGTALRDGAGRLARRLRERLELVGRALRSPDRLVDLRAERSDRLRGDLDRALAHRIALRERRLAALAGRLAARSPWRRMLEQAALAERAGVRLRHALARLVETRERRVALAGARLGGADPTAIMERGYAVVMRGGRAVKCAADAGIGDRVEVRLHRGALACEVKDVRK